VRKKGFDVLIDAARLLQSRHPELVVAIAGEGDLHDELARRATDVPAVRLPGNQSQDEIAALCAAADVVAVPAVHDEAGNVDGLPNFALEALASATPVVASRVGGLPQAIDDEATGLLVPEKDARALAQAIGRLLDEPPLGRALGRAARLRVEREF